MSAEVLTERLLKTLQPEAVRYELPDAGGPIGAFVYVSTKGRISYGIRFGPKWNRRLVVGSWPAQSLKALRAKAGKARQVVEDGGDPVADRREQRETARQAETRRKAIEAGDPLPGTVRELVARYLKVAKRRQRERSYEQTELHLRTAVEAWGDREVSSLTRKDIIALVEDRRDQAADRGRHPDPARRGIVPAVRLLAAVSACLSYAAHKGELGANPALGINRSLLGLREQARERVLTEEELRRVWAALGEIQPVHAAAVKMILLTAQRPGEVLAMRWRDLQEDSNGRFWLLPASHKAGVARRIPLSPQAVETLEELRETWRHLDSPWCFPSGGRSGRVEWIAQPVQRLAKAAGVERFTAHDCRRTARTFMSSFGVRPEVAERVLGHKVGDKIEQTYDRHSYDGEQRQAVVILGDRIQAIVEGRPAVSAVRRIG